MDKKTILGIVVVAALFLGFAYFNTKQQEKYQQEMAAYQAYQDSVAAATRPVVPVADSTAVAGYGCARGCGKCRRCRTPAAGRCVGRIPRRCA